MVTEYSIKWSKPALASFKSQIAYIKKDSPKNADKVKQAILTKIGSLANNPQLYPPDKYKLFNKNNAYRAFELFRIRISYFVAENTIVITRVRHTKQAPSLY